MKERENVCIISPHIWAVKGDFIHTLGVGTAKSFSPTYLSLNLTNDLNKLIDLIHS